jgi:hypothetical protein
MQDGIACRGRFNPIFQTNPLPEWTAANCGSPQFSLSAKYFQASIHGYFVYHADIVPYTIWNILPVILTCPAIFVPTEMRENLKEEGTRNADGKVQTGADRGVVKADRGGGGEWEDNAAGVQGSRGIIANVLPVA